MRKGERGREEEREREGIGESVRVIERRKKRGKEERKGDCVLVDLSHFQCKFSSDGTNE
jgi:hypothetical protein